MCKYSLQRLFATLKLLFSPNNPKALLLAGHKPKPIGPHANPLPYVDKKIHFAETPTLYRTIRNGKLEKITPPKVKALYGNKDWGRPRPLHSFCTTIR